jgi:hypothetical protein
VLLPTTPSELVSRFSLSTSCPSYQYLLFLVQPLKPKALSLQIYKTIWSSDDAQEPLLCLGLIMAVGNVGEKLAH